MQFTRKQLMDYPYLDRVIEQEEKKLERYINNPPVAMHGKVSGSNHVFPYQLRSFTVSGPDIVDFKQWDAKRRYLEVKLDSDKKFHERLKMEIDEMIAGIEEPRDKMVVEYITQGMKQSKIAKLLNIDQSTVSRTIDKYVKAEK